MLTKVSAESESAARLRLAITRVARRLRQEANADLSPSLTSALASIEGHGPVTPSELANCERVQRPTITRVLTRLTELGLIERAADPADGRSTLVSITPSGRALLNELRTRRDAFLADRLSKLSPEDRAVLDRASAVLESLLEDES
jgi:DNA-binding MarR family transcriptional regulator